MLPVIISFVTFAGLFIYLIPSSRSKVAGILYLILIGLFIWGIGGFVFSGNPTTNEQYVFYAFYIFILGIHVPLLIKFSQINHRKESLKSAKKILGSDVKHLTEDELHYRLKH